MNLSRHTAISMERAISGDGDFVRPVIQTLRELANMMEAKEAGFSSVEAFVSSNGTRVILISGTWRGALLPDKGPGLGDA